MVKIKGIIVPMITPLCGEDQIDSLGTARLVENLISGGVSSIFILGTTGESQSLSYSAKYEFVKLVSDLIHQRVPLLVCITDTSMGESLRLATYAAECGATGVVAAPPYYFAASQQELYDYYIELADKCPLPLFLYNMPSHVKVFLEAATVVRLAEHPNIAGLKDSSANMTYFQSLLYLLRDKRERFALYVGPEEFTGVSVLSGADGGVNGGANMFPELYVDMYKAASEGNLVAISELQNRIMAISNSIYNVGAGSSSYLRGLKCALSVLGICDDFVARPYCRFGTRERAIITEALKTLG